MALKPRTFRIGEPPKRGAGIRLGVVRQAAERDLPAR